MVLAARGARNLDRGEQKISDPETAAQLRRQARKIHIQSIIVAALLTVLTLVPWR